MKSLTKQQRNHMVRTIVGSINNGQTNDEYSFGDELDIVWSPDDEAYRISTSKVKNTWVRPYEIELWIKYLSDRALVEGYCSAEYIELEEFPEHIEEAMAA